MPCVHVDCKLPSLFTASSLCWFVLVFVGLLNVWDKRLIEESWASGVCNDDLVTHFYLRLYILIITNIHS